MKLVEPKIFQNVQAGKETGLDSTIRKMIADGRWTTGQRLPSERVLSAELKVSRNTLRSVLKCLEATGLLEIRKSSGCYVAEDIPEEKNSDRDSQQDIIVKYEAGILILPEIFAAASLKLKVKDFQDLDACTGALGQAILERDWKELIARSQEFSLITVRCLNNHIVTEIVRELCESAYVFLPYLTRTQKASRTRFFRDFVMLLKALRKRDQVLVRFAIKRKIINAAHAFTSVTGVPLTPVLVAAHEELTKFEGEFTSGAMA